MEVSELVSLKQYKGIKKWCDVFVCVVRCTRLVPHNTASTVLTVTNVQLMHLLTILSCAQSTTIVIIIITPLSLYRQVDRSRDRRPAKRDSLHGAGGGSGKMLGVGLVTPLNLRSVSL